ncbi:hypothetical protein HYU11_03760 [Candidatus Woesearchaeota archaeon]|nr:hypothetical protein [Candidatus Woesearchaeota archaeon]
MPEKRLNEQSIIAISGVKDKSIPEGAILLSTAGVKSFFKFFYFTCQIFAFLEGQAIRQILMLFSLVEVNFFMSLISGIVIGHFSFILAEKMLKNRQTTLIIGVPFIKEIEMSSYQLFINSILFLIFYISLYFLKLFFNTL